jgi:hypothetical protein
MTFAEEIGFAPQVGDELWAWVTDVPDGTRSLVGVWIGPEEGHMPLIFATQEKAIQATPFALAHGKSLGQEVRLVHFKAVEQFEARKVDR